jgi:acid phosphatase type 7
VRLSTWCRAVAPAILFATCSILAGIGGGLVAPAAAEPGAAILLATGDIDGCRSEGEATAQLVAKMAGPVATVGDNGYPEADAESFSRCYDPAWGFLKDRTRPIPGNHEYDVSKAAPYFEYFGAAAGEPGRGWYSYDVGSWHVVALNSNCDAVDCEEQTSWLERDLSDHPSACIAAYWHHPRFTSGTSGGDSAVGAFWNVLYSHGATLVLAGHDHIYERFAPQDPSGDDDPERGIRQFIVGTGGATLGGFAGTAPHSEVRNNRAYGVLELTLRSGGYDWRFVSVDGDSFTDSGSDRCRGTAPAPATPPTSAAPPPPPPEAPPVVEPAATAPAPPPPAPKDPPVAGRRPRSGATGSRPASRPNRAAGSGAGPVTPAPSRAAPPTAPPPTTTSLEPIAPAPTPAPDAEVVTGPPPAAPQPDGAATDSRALALAISGLIETPPPPAQADRRGLTLVAIALMAADCAAIGTLRRRRRSVLSR